MKPTKIDTQAALHAVSQATTALTALQADKAQIEEGLHVLEDRRRVLLRAPLPLDHMKSLAIDAIDRAGVEFLRQGGLRDYVHQFVAPTRHRPPIEGPRSEDANRRLQLHRPFGLNLQDVRAGAFGAGVELLGLIDAQGRLSNGAMCLLFGDQLKALLDDQFERVAPKVDKPAGVSDDDVAMTVDQRMAELARLDAKEEELQAQLLDVTGQIEQISLALKGPAQRAGTAV